jgi:serpin B
MMKNFIISVMAAIIALSSAVFAVSGHAYDVTGMEKSSEAVNSFAFELYKELSPGKGNVFCSPYSISSAMALLYAGTAGDALREVGEVLRFDGDIHQSMSELKRSLENSGGNAEISVANALWPDISMKLLPSYVDTVKKYYGAENRQLDFKTNWRKAENTINKWVNDKTKGEIKSLFERDSLAPAGDLVTALVLTNAIYFKSDWLLPFNEKRTTEEPFYGALSEETVKMMSRTDYFDYFGADEFQMIRLPYEGKKFSMTVILPKEGVDLNALTENLSLAKYREYSGEMRRQKISVFFPKFELDMKYELVGVFKKMGLRSVFEPNSDNFSNLGVTDSGYPLYVSRIVHKAKVKVDETGTVAAAATGVAVVMATSAGPGREPPVFRADRPFAFFITDDTTGAILFLGRYSQP